MQKKHLQFDSRMLFLAILMSHEHETVSKTHWESVPLYIQDHNKGIVQQELTRVEISVAHSTQPNPVLWPTARKSSQIFTAWLHSLQWPIVHYQIRRSGPRKEIKSRISQRTQIFKSLFETAIDHEAGGQLVL
jgi:hypothetical protein